MERIFIAFDTPPEVRPGLVSVRDRLKESHADVRWEAEEKFHCTLKFLGDTQQEKVGPVIGFAEAMGASSFDVIFRSIGCFPGKRDPKVLWVGIENADGKLQSLFQQIDQGMEALGFPRERRSFHGHITLGRIKSGKNVGKLLEMMERITFESQPVTIQSIEVIKSELKPNGSVYTILKSIPLRA